MADKDSWGAFWYRTGGRARPLRHQLRLFLPPGFRPLGPWESPHGEPAPCLHPRGITHLEFLVDHSTSLERVVLPQMAVLRCTKSTPIRSWPHRSPGNAVDSSRPASFRLKSESRSRHASNKTQCPIGHWVLFVMSLHPAMRARIPEKGFRSVRYGSCPSILPGPREGCSQHIFVPCRPQNGNENPDNGLPPCPSCHLVICQGSGMGYSKHRFRINECPIGAGHACGNVGWAGLFLPTETTCGSFAGGQRLAFAHPTALSALDSGQKHAGMTMLAGPNDDGCRDNVSRQWPSFVRSGSEILFL